MSSSINIERSAKFLFDKDFDDGSPSAGAKAALEAAKIEKMRAEAREEGVQEGIRRGREEKTKELEGQILLALTKLQRDISVLLAETETYKADLTHQVHMLTLAAIEQLHPELACKGEIAEIGALLVKVMHEQPEEARLILSLRPDLAEAMKAQLDSLIQHAAFTGKVVLAPNDGMNVGDCRIEWQHGGIERDLSTLHTAITNLLHEEGVADHGK